MKTARTVLSAVWFVALALACAAAQAQTPGAATEPLAAAPAAPAAPSEEPAPAPPPPGSEPGKIFGSVHSLGVPLNSATITLTNEETKESKTIQTNPQGEFQLKGLADGTYLVGAEAPGYSYASAKVKSGSGAVDFYVRGLMAWEPLSPFFSWAFKTWLGERIRASDWAVAYLEVFHLLGITVLLGSVVALSLRLSGLAMRSLPTAEVAREIRPYMWGGLALVLASGIPMFASEAEKVFQSRPFELKMTYFALANIFQFVAVAMATRVREGSSRLAVESAALIAVAYWYMVAWQGRAIAFF